MNIQIIKNKLRKLGSNKLKIKVYAGRKKYEYYSGYIKNLYPNIFTLDTDKGLKSFSYSDIATKAIILSKFN